MHSGDYMSETIFNYLTGMMDSEDSAAPLALQADKINLTISSTPTPFFI